MYIHVHSNHYFEPCIYRIIHPYELMSISKGLTQGENMFWFFPSSPLAPWPHWLGGINTQKEGDVEN